MGARNYLIEGVSCSGKTTVCDELLHRGFQAIHGDRQLAYQGDPETGLPLPGRCHEHHIWDIEKVHQLVCDKSQPVTFFCGGSRNFHRFIDWFDGVFILRIDADTLRQRLDQRPPDNWGGNPEQRALIEYLYKTGDGLPENGIDIDATQPPEMVVDQILDSIAASENRPVKDQ